MRDTKHEQIRRMTRFIRMLDSIGVYARDKTFLSDIEQITRWTFKQVDLLTAPKVAKDLGTRAAYKKEEIQRITKEFADIIRAMEYDKDFDRVNSLRIYRWCTDLHWAVEKETVTDFASCSYWVEQIEEIFYGMK